MILSNGALVPNSLQRTLADETPVFHDPSYYSTAAMALSGQLWAHYGAIYRAQLWVGIVVRKRAYGTARMPFEITLPGPGSTRVLEAGQLQELMDAPNRRMSGFQLWQWTSATRDLYGEAFWLKLRDDRGRVRELQPIHPRNITIRRNLETGDVEYVYGAGGGNPEGQPVFPESDVVAFTTYNPDNVLRGVSNLESLRMTLLNEDAARRATSSFWDKGARPSMILTHPGELSKGAQDRLKERAQQAMGGADRMGGISVFEEGITATVTQLSNEDMQYIDSRKLNREEVCAAYDVSPLVVHILDHATFSNVTEQLRSQYRDTMAPIFTDLQSIIDAQLVPDFYDRNTAKSRFNMDDVLRGDFEARATTGLSLRQSGVFTGNEARQFVGADPLEDPNMNLVFANSALQPLGQSPRPLLAGAPAPGIPSNGPGNAAGDGGARALDADLAAMRKLAGKNFLGRPALRGIMGRLPAQLKAAGTRADIRETMIRAHEEALYDYYDALHDDVMQALGVKADGDLFDRDIWDANLKEVLLVLARKTAAATGEAVAGELGAAFKPEWVEDWLDINAELGAELFNKNTAETLAEMLAADWEDEAEKLRHMDDTFKDGGLIRARAAEQAITRTTAVSEFAAYDTAQRTDDTSKVTKTWEVNSTNPRPSHAAVNGETVGVEENFSIGMLYPGDWAGGFDEIAGCQCTVSYSKESD
jgi:HK97 family phage portal protein